MPWSENHADDPLANDNEQTKEVFAHFGLAFYLSQSGGALAGPTARHRCGTSREGRLFSKWDHEFESAFLQR